MVWAPNVIHMPAHLANLVQCEKPLVNRRRRWSFADPRNIFKYHSSRTVVVTLIEIFLSVRAELTLAASLWSGSDALVSPGIVSSERTDLFTARRSRLVHKTRRSLSVPLTR